MPVPDSQINFILDQLGSLHPVSSKRMFGGVGFFKEGKMFGMLNSKGTFLMKVDQSNLSDYLDRGMPPFTMKGKASMSYYQVPLDVLENQNELKLWAQKSIDIALNA